MNLLERFHSPLPEETHFACMAQCKLKAKPLSAGLVFSFTTKATSLYLMMMMIGVTLFGVYGSGVVSYPPNSNADFQLQCNQF